MRKRSITSFLSSVICVAMVFSLIVKAVNAATTDTVTATVTAIVYSVSLDNGDGIAFGAVGTSATKDTTTNGVDDSTTATNDGSVAEKFNIQASDTAAWTFASNTGPENYWVKSCIADCDSAPSWAIVGDASQAQYVQLVTNVAKDATQTFDLQVGTPITTTATAAQSITITVQAGAT